MNSNVRSIRLFGDGIIDSEREVGVLEVFVDSRWGVVCASQSESTNELNARILCETFKGKNGGAKPVRLSLSRCVYILAGAWLLTKVSHTDR